VVYEQMPARREEFRCKWPGCTHPPFQGNWPSQNLSKHHKKCMFRPANMARAPQVVTEEPEEISPSPVTTTTTTEAATVRTEVDRATEGFNS